MTHEEYARMHQKAFRIAFDFLHSHFPPGDTDEWWEKFARDCADASIAGGETKLVIELLAAVVNYIDNEYKRRHNNGGTEN